MSIDLVADALAMLADFGESITYTPFGGTARTITAILDYGDGTALESIGGRQVQAVTITVANDATSGIDRATLDTGRDTVMVPLYPGGPAKTRKFRIVSEDAGALVLEAH